MSVKNQIHTLVLNRYSKFTEIVNHLLKPSFGIRNTNSNNKFSKFGGIPDVPPNFQYPKHNNIPLSFFCQIDLEELKTVNIPTELPTKGILYFFILTKNLSRYPDQKGEYRVIHSENDINLSKYEYDQNIPLPDIFKEEFIDFYEDYSMPEYPSLINPKYEKYEEIINEIDSEIKYITQNNEINRNKIGSHLEGYTKSLQQPVMLLLSNEVKSNDNVLLLQLDFEASGSNFTKIFGNSIAYFLLQREDLIEKNFSNVKLILQND